MMTMYSSENCLDSHRVRVVLAEKGLNVEIIHIEQDRSAIGDLAELSPYGEPPTLVDRDLVVYGTWVVTEYLDERYPHPPLMPVDPGFALPAEACVVPDPARLDRQRPNHRDVDRTQARGNRTQAAARQYYRVGSPVRPVAVPAHDELSLVDCALLPLLWRLPGYGIDLPAKSTVHIHRYMDRMFSRDAFQRSLTEAERAYREEDE